MIHRVRYWRTYPAVPENPDRAERHRRSRVVAICLSVGLLGCVAAIAVLFVLVLNLHDQRDREVIDRTRAIDQAMCSVLNDFHSTDPDLVRARADLHCSTPTA